jgi:hypothetical protein
MDSLRAKAKDAQAELGYIALVREDQNARWDVLKKQLQEGEREFAALQAAPVDADRVE